MGRPRRSAIAPIFRSDAQGRILAAIYLGAEPLHVRAIADRTQLGYSVVQREVDRLEESSLIKTTRFGTSRVVRPNENHALYSELRALLMKAYGPQHVLAELLSGEPGVVEAFLFGSWADRYVGNWGPEWGDIDVAVIGELTGSRAEELEAEAEDLLGFPTQVTVIDSQAWSHPADGFVKTVKSRPLVPITLEIG